ncbi:MAG TPA: CehA/McbA family metallohydrolase [Methylomirabilota bacterium]|nr:CehA/McbA family metallohydrolase [Methylomirabilota bacterium]
MSRLAIVAFFFALLLPLSKPAALLTNSVVLNSGSAVEWDHLSAFPTAGSNLNISLPAGRNDREQLLLVEHEDVRNFWEVILNGKTLGRLTQSDQSLISQFTVPAGTFLQGTNHLRISSKDKPDQILIRRVDLLTVTREQRYSGGVVRIIVREDGEALPCRITVTTTNDVLTPFEVEAARHLAVRTGVVYTATGEVTLRLPEGPHRIYASRGPEYSVANNHLHIRANESHALNLTLRREVDTSGWIAADTHIHTFTHSRHGDASVQERAITLAGEGIEFAVATDHNTHVDLAPHVRELGLDPWLTTVVGNEVTTGRGHFNIFPVEPNARVVDFRIQDWKALFQSIRATPGVQVAVMNHPTDIHLGFRPFARTNFNPVTGLSASGEPYPMDAIELINSAALQSDQTEVFRHWFALLNSGQRTVGVGASDSHEVSRFIVGQGRTYIASSAGRMGEVPVEDTCSNLLSGRAIASLGLFLKVTAGGTNVVGSLLRSGRSVRVEASGPSWAPAHHVALFANGIEVTNRPLPSPSAPGVKGALSYALPNRRYDYALVALVTGTNNLGPFWSLPKPYQATSTRYEPRLFAIANPVYVDANGDGKFTSPRAEAARLLSEAANSAPKLLRLLAECDEPVAAHAASLWPGSPAELLRLADDQPAHVRRGIRAYIKTQAGLQ